MEPHILAMILGPISVVMMFGTLAYDAKRTERLNIEWLKCENQFGRTDSDDFRRCYAAGELRVLCGDSKNCRRGMGAE